MDFRIKKPKYYVAVLTNRGLELVTRVDYKDNMWYAEDDKPPMTFTKQLAEELVICCRINYTPAFIMYTTNDVELKYQMFKHEEEE